MNTTVLSVVLSTVISGSISITAAILSDTLGRRRDRENDWRKLKLQKYQDFALALSRTISRASQTVDRRTYADTVNTLLLVASPTVIEKLDTFQNAIAAATTKEDPAAESALSDLLREIRCDCQPRNPKDPESLAFRLRDQ